VVLYSTRVSSAGEPAIGINAMDKSVYLFTESESVNKEIVIVLYDTRSSDVEIGVTRISEQ